MKTATLRQAKKVLELLEGIPAKQVQSLLASGLLSDLLNANVAEIDRHEFRKFCGLVPIRVKDLKITTAQFDAIDFIGENWEILSEEQDERLNALKEVDFAKVEFLPGFTGKDRSIVGNREFSLLKRDEKNRIRYGATVFMGLWLNYQEEKEISILECLYQARDIDNIVFFGDVLSGPVSQHHVLCLFRCDDGIWNWRVNELHLVWYDYHVSAVSPPLTT
ncbi:hypothetical protein AMJ47_00805 [Parcubacteria bacterium DG_72]|nr:MAG: hypothetical protein AMJ47_00805 [Parcubacteria bacterium DG_72]